RNIAILWQGAGLGRQRVVVQLVAFDFAIRLWLFLRRRRDIVSGDGVAFDPLGSTFGLFQRAWFVGDFPRVFDLSGLLFLRNFLWSFGRIRSCTRRFGTEALAAQRYLVEQIGHAAKQAGIDQERGGDDEGSDEGQQDGAAREGEQQQSSAAGREQGANKVERDRRAHVTRKETQHSPAEHNPRHRPAERGKQNDGEQCP